MKKISRSKSPAGETVANAVPVTRAMVHAHARELALIAGRTPAEVTYADYEQSKRELTGESDMDQQDAILDSIPEEKTLGSRARFNRYAGPGVYGRR